MISAVRLAHGKLPCICLQMEPGDAGGAWHQPSSHWNNTQESQRHTRRLDAIKQAGVHFPDLRLSCAQLFSTISAKPPDFSLPSAILMTGFSKGLM